MEAKKESEKIFPTHVTGMDLTQVLKTSLRELVSDGAIRAGVTTNDYYIQSTDESKNQELLKQKP